MTRPSRSGVIVGISICIVAACGGAPSPAAQATATPSLPAAHATEAPARESPATGRVVMAPTACTVASGDFSSAAGFVLEVWNETEYGGGFDLYRLHDDTSYDEWVAYNRVAETELVAGGEGPGDPRGIADPVDVMEAVAAGGQGRLIATSARAGTYALQCWQFDGDATVALDAAGPIVVGP